MSTLGVLARCVGKEKFSRDKPYSLLVVLQLKLMSCVLGAVDHFRVHPGCAGPLCGQGEIQQG